MDKILKLFGSNEQLWLYIQKYAKTAGIEATKTVLELYYVVKSPDTTILDKTVIVAALAYQILPEDLIKTEDFGLLGLLDNGAALALAYNRVKTRVTPQITAQVNAVLGQWFECCQPSINGTHIGNNDYNRETDSIKQRQQPEEMLQVQPQNINRPQQRPKATDSLLWDEDDVVID